MKGLYVKGIVSPGEGQGARFIELPWVKKQMAEKLGFTPHSGTLNLKLAEGELEKRRLLEKADGKEISPAKGFSRGILLQANLADYLECAIIIPKISNYPKDTIEIVAPISLRKELDLKDGDSVEVKILTE